MASKALGLALGLGAVVVFMMAILAFLTKRLLTGEGATEDVLVISFLAPASIVCMFFTAFELSVVLPRRLCIDAFGIHIRFSPWSLRRSKVLPRQLGRLAQVLKKRHSNYATYASGQISHAKITSDRFFIRYGTGYFGPVDEDQARSLADTINDALARTAPVN